MIESKTVLTYLGALAVVFAVSAYKNKFGDANSKTNDLIREYLLNESPLYGMNKPKLWIHTVYNVNARAWRTGERNSTNLNQPYIHTVIKTIINKCGDDFNVCLIDDASFAKLLPSFDLSLPLSQTQREYALMQLLYVYGGIVVPNTFICMQSLLPLLSDTVPKFSSGAQIMSAPKFSPLLLNIAGKWLGTQSLHSSSEENFVNNKNKILANEIQQGHAELIDARLIGKATVSGKPITLDDLMGEDFINLSPDAYGVLVNGDEVLERAKHKWLAYMSTAELMHTNLIMVKFMKASLADKEYFQNESGVKKSITAI